MKVDSLERTSPVENFSKESKPKSQKEISAEAVIEKNDMSETEWKRLPMAEKIVIQAIEKANKAIEGARTEFRFSIHEETHEIMVKVIDKDEGKVLREIPPEKILDIVARMWEMAGIIVDERR